MNAKKQKIETTAVKPSLDALDLLKASGRGHLRLLKGRELRQCVNCRSVSLATLKSCPSCGKKH